MTSITLKLHYFEVQLQTQYKAPSNGIIATLSNYIGTGIPVDFLFLEFSLLDIDSCSWMVSEWLNACRVISTVHVNIM